MRLLAECIFPYTITNGLLINLPILNLYSLKLIPVFNGVAAQISS